MGSKLLVMIATGDREKALAGLMYACNILKNRWLDDVKVVFFGPSENWLLTMTKWHGSSKR